jgi:hypothetical protein
LAFLFDLLDFSLIHLRYLPETYIDLLVTLNLPHYSNKVPPLKQHHSRPNSNRTSLITSNPLKTQKCTPARISHEDAVVESILKVQNAKTARYVVGRCRGVFRFRPNIFLRCTTIESHHHTPLSSRNQSTIEDHHNMSFNLMSLGWNWARQHDAIMTLHTMNATMFDIFSDGVGGLADYCGLRKRASRDREWECTMCIRAATESLGTGC